MKQLDPKDLFFEAGGGTSEFDPDRYYRLIRERILGEGSEFPDPADVNWELLNELAGKPHPLLNNEVQIPDELPCGWQEMYYEVRAAHHLLDLIGVPYGYSLDTRDIDSRILLAIRGITELRERLSRISSWHARETGPAGTVGDYCTECGRRCPCDTRRMADGVYPEEDA